MLAQSTINMWIMNMITRPLATALTSSNLTTLCPKISESKKRNFLYDNTSVFLAIVSCKSIERDVMALFKVKIVELGINENFLTYDTVSIEHPCDFFCKKLFTHARKRLKPNDENILETCSLFVQEPLFFRWIRIT